jgi:hypothetical protein
MTRKVLLSLALFILLLATLGSTYRAEQWEYKIHIDHTGSVDVLNRLGADGWELVQVEQSGSRGIYWLKRRK